MSSFETTNDYDTAHSEHFAQANARLQHIDSLENQITELAAHIHAATFRLLELIREYDESKGWCGMGLRTCAHWLNWKSVPGAYPYRYYCHPQDFLPSTPLNCLKNHSGMFGGSVS